MGNELNYWQDYFENSKPDMLSENFKFIQGHMRRMKARGMRDRTLVNHYQFLTHFGSWCKIAFTELTEDELLDYSELLDKQKYKAGTKYVKLATIKAFLKGINPDAAKTIIAKPHRNKKLPEDLLTQKDIEALLDNCGNNRDRALIATLYESGMRKGELFSLRIKNIQFDENGAILTIPDGKTGARRIRLVFASPFLREWLEVHPTKENRESPVFCSLRNPYNVITDPGLRDQLVKIAEKARVQKRVNPHSFRHARATHLAEHLTEQQLKKYLGWTEGSNMAATYVHLSGKDIDNAILKMNGIIIDDTHVDGLKVGRCPRCHELNQETALYCVKCGLPLQEELKSKIEKDSAAIDLEVMKAAVLNPEILKEILKRIEKNS
jgi:Site-specific recombinase XerD